MLWGYHMRDAYLQEVFRAAIRRRRDVTVSFGNGGEDCEFRLEVLSEVHDGGDVAAAVAVVGCAPDGDDGLVFKMPLYALLASAEPYRGQNHSVPCTLH